MKSGLKCLKDEATHCMKGPMQAATLMIMNDQEANVNEHCDSPQHRSDFLQHIQCFQDVSKADAVRLCVDRHLTMMELIATKPKETWHGTVCCANTAMNNCIIDTITKQCSGDTGAYFSDMIQEGVRVFFFFFL